MRASFSPLFSLLIVSLFFSACSTSKKMQTDMEIELDEVNVKPVSEYNASATRINDLLHTELHVRFDHLKQRLIGTATLTLKPYAKSVSSVELDAKGFDLLKVGRMDGSDFLELPFQYDSLELTIDLKKTYSESDTFHIRIEYIAKPNELPEGGSEAISSDKGLYFINPLGKEKNKPFQIWTQGETEASSCWFPTIDKPNERTTQETYITVADSLVTLSNGLLIQSTENADGTRTDYWKMDMPHAPYLFMMAMGDFAVVRDKWRGKPVDYYVEKAYEPFAFDIFGNTPEMLDFYSKILGLDYPWQKYAQVCVRDYVSGAMENTTATVHFENMQLTKRELIDMDYEDIIAHELFHQWFGDYVTCESWANLTLNEGFATYGEYLWIEHKYGIDMAERHRMEDYQKYIAESWQYKEPLIRFHYSDKEEMFDSHSYSKGGLVLHMLRKYLGDEVFFRALNVYLRENAFQTVEVHQLRLAFEKASGEDLNWFFNQWYLSPGHPRLNISYDFNSQKSIATISIKQTQDEKPFRLPLAIDIHTAGGMQRENVTVEKREQVFELAVNGKPLLINVDGDRNLLCEWDEEKSAEEWVYQYENTAGYWSKRDALVQLSEMQNENAFAKATLIKALKDSCWWLRKLAVEKLPLDAETKSLLAEVISKDAKASVRAAAIEKLAGTKDEQYQSLYENALNDSSLLVIAHSLDAFFALDKDEAMRKAQKFEEFTANSIVSTLSDIYAEAGTDDKQNYFERMAYATTSYSRYNVISGYGDFLKNRNGNIIRKGVKTLEDIAMNAGSMWERFGAAHAIHKVHVSMDDKEESASLQDETREELKDFLDKMLDKIVSTEKNKNLLDRYRDFE